MREKNNLKFELSAVRVTRSKKKMKREDKEVLCEPHTSLANVR